MVLHNCSVCAVYELGQTVQKRMPVKCCGEQIYLLLRTKQELSGLAGIRIDFFDSRIGCIKTRCELSVRQNFDPSITAPWVADCGILEVVEITEGRRYIRAEMGKKVTLTLLGRGDFTGIIQNISERGIYFITAESLQCCDAVMFIYSFIEKEHRVKATILREEPFRDGRNGYGCQFLELSRGAERDIRQYVYLRQQGRIW